MSLYIFKASKSRQKLSQIVSVVTMEWLLMVVANWCAAIWGQVQREAIWVEISNTQYKSHKSHLCSATKMLATLMFFGNEWIRCHVCMALKHPQNWSGEVDINISVTLFGSVKVIVCDNHRKYCRKIIQIENKETEGIPLYIICKKKKKKMDTENKFLTSQSYFSFLTKVQNSSLTSTTGITEAIRSCSAPQSSGFPYKPFSRM